MRQIGILGGTFDPIHNAHIAMAETAYRQMELDKVIFLPAKVPPHKQGRRITNDRVRCEMVKLAVKDYDYFECSDFECKLNEVNYTANTLKYLKEIYKDDKLYFIIGGDSLFDFEKWYHPELVLKRAVILAVGRGGKKHEELVLQSEYLMNKYGGNIKILDMKDIDISSTEIRRKLAGGESVKGLMPEKVYEYIVSHKIEY